MGFATAGVLGAKLAAPEKPAVAFVGDGSFLMTPQVLATAKEYNIPAVWVIMNNHAYGSIRNLQNGYFKREICTSFKDSQTGDFYNPDFAKLASAFGVNGLRVEHPGELPEALESAIKSNKPYVIDVVVNRDIHPMGTGSWQFHPFPAAKPNFKAGK